jgi:predicted TIM-barrel fold metal-dependent hydrolase
MKGTANLAGAAILGITPILAADETKAPSASQRGSFIDAHVHVWTHQFQKYPLASGVSEAEMKPATFLPSDILHRATPSGVARVVLVQMSYYGTDNSYMLDAIRQSPHVFRGIAVVDPESSQPDASMRKLAKDGVRGFRIYPPEGTSPPWFAGEGFTKMFRCGAEHGLAMCLLANPSDLAAVDRQCEKFPETPVIIDHMARIGRDGVILESDIMALCTLARHPHVKVKVSAFYALGNRTPPHLDLAPLIKRLFEAYGPRRLMWASDCPFQVEKETYEDGISLVRDRLDFLSDSDKEWMLHKTAEDSFFRL